jgi:hypothetical protein
MMKFSTMTVVAPGLTVATAMQMPWSRGGLPMGVAAATAARATRLALSVVSHDAR